jgi:hypothetical protein
MSSYQVEKNQGGQGDVHHIESQMTEKMGTGEIPVNDSHHKTKQERRVVLKQDLTIVPLLSMCFFFAYLVNSLPFLLALLSLWSFWLTPLVGSWQHWECPNYGLSRRLAPDRYPVLQLSHDVLWVPSFGSWPMIYDQMLTRS